MNTVIKKWGNSLGIRIPNLIVKELSLKDGTCVEIKDNDNEIIISPRKNTSLSEMLSLINKNNIHDEIETGISVGKEIW